jgi:NDP-sugar pyrophosphorylase family protein
VRPPTQAVILAAGEGRRLAPLTDALPKPLVPFFGRPLLDWAVRAAVEAGVSRIGINAFHLAEQIEAHVEKLRARYPRIAFELSREAALLGTGGGVRRLAERGFLQNEPFWVINSDAVFAEPLAAMAAAVPDEAAGLLVTRAEPWADARRLVTHPDSRRLASLDERGRPDSGWTFCGVTLADADLPARLPEGASCILRQGFVPWLDALRVEVVPTDGFFADTGTPADLAAAHLRGRTWVEALADASPFAGGPAVPDGPEWAAQAPS